MTKVRDALHPCMNIFANVFCTSLFGAGFVAETACVAGHAVPRALSDDLRCSLARCEAPHLAYPNCSSNDYNYVAQSRYRFVVSVARVQVAHTVLRLSPGAAHTAARYAFPACNVSAC